MATIPDVSKSSPAVLFLLGVITIQTIRDVLSRFLISSDRLSGVGDDFLLFGVDRGIFGLKRFLFGHCSISRMGL
jgi:hypothetical protein